MLTDWMPPVPGSRAGPDPGAGAAGHVDHADGSVNSPPFRDGVQCIVPCQIPSGPDLGRRGGRAGCHGAAAARRCGWRRTLRVAQPRPWPSPRPPSSSLSSSFFCSSSKPRDGRRGLARAGPGSARPSGSRSPDRCVPCCQAAIISRVRAPKVPSVPSVLKPSALSATWTCWRSSSREAQRILALDLCGLRFGSLSSGLCALAAASAASAAAFWPRPSSSLRCFSAISASILRRVSSSICWRCAASCSAFSRAAASARSLASLLLILQALRLGRHLGVLRRLLDRRRADGGGARASGARRLAVDQRVVAAGQQRQAPRGRAIHRPMPRRSAGAAPRRDAAAAAASSAALPADRPSATVASASSAAAWPRIGRQPAMVCGRSLARTARPASRPASSAAAKSPAAPSCQRLVGVVEHAVEGAGRRLAGDGVIERRRQAVDVGPRALLGRGHLLGRGIARREDRGQRRRCARPSPRARRRSRSASGCPSASSRMLAGLMSRCRKPALWTCSSPSSSGHRMRSIVAGGSGPVALQPAARASRRCSSCHDDVGGAVGLEEVEDPHDGRARPAGWPACGLRRRSARGPRRNPRPRSVERGSTVVPSCAHAPAPAAGIP